MFRVGCGVSDSYRMKSGVRIQQIRPAEANPEERDPPEFDFQGMP
jgi:hypothetical protein